MTRATVARRAPSPARLLLERIAFFVVLFALYQLVVSLDPGLQRNLPTLQALGGGFLTLFQNPVFWQAIGHTALATVLGLAFSILIGGVLGLLLSIHRNAYASARFVVDFMRTIPPLALIPLGLLLIGPSMQMEVILIVTAALWPVLVQVYYGVANVEPKLLETARSYRMPLWRRLVFVTLPAIGPSFATAVRLSATLCLLLAVGTELLAGTGGLGAMISLLQQANAVPQTNAAIIIAGLMGVILNGGLILAERRLLHWHFRTTRKGATV